MLTFVEILTPLTPRSWHLALCERLRAQGRTCWLRPVASPERVEGFDTLARIERRLYRTPPNGDSASVAAPVDAPASRCDLRIDLSGRAPSTADVPCLVALADGAPGEGAMLAALLDGHAPHLAVGLWRGDGLQLLAQALPAIEEPHQIIRSLDRCCARLVDVILAAVRVAEGQAPPANPIAVQAAPQPGRGALAQALLRQVAGRIRERIQRMSGREAQWRVAWRHAPDGTRVCDTLAWPAAPYHVLPDDGSRYYADPFLFVHEGRTWLYVEDYPYATGRGLISVVEMGSQGPLGTPVPILDESCHLSYPQVFAHEGVTYMIPETSGRGTIELWRATRLPDRWEPVAVLAQGLVAADATLLHHEGRWWIFATLAEAGQSSWDSLALFMADRLEGPWRPHPANPVLIDARSARPAGRMFLRGTALMRPVQDCSGGYGSALGFAQVTQLTPAAYGQEAGPVLRPRPGWGAVGVHTLDAAGGFEVIDVLVPPTAQLAPA